MSYNDRLEYDDDFVFTNEHLAEVTAGDVVAWFNHRAYGVDVSSENDRPVHARANTLYYWKKALSSFFPNRNMTWDELTKRGNPTRSQELNDMIRKVKKFEVRGQGVESKARRPLKEAEFRRIIQELRRVDNDIIANYGIPALLAFQFHMLGRVDDSSKWMKKNVGVHDAYPKKAGKARLAWSKNVNDERDAPWQHLFGCMDPIFCVFIHVGLWLEIFHGIVPEARDRPFVFAFTDDMDDIEKAAAQVKAKVYSVVRPLLDVIGLDIDGLLGSHSIRKYASTWVRSNGISKDDKDHRGRWKNSTRISDGYGDVQLDFVGAKVAAVLCPGGVCNYAVKDPACTKE